MCKDQGQSIPGSTVSAKAQRQEQCEDCRDRAGRSKRSGHLWLVQVRSFRSKLHKMKSEKSTGLRDPGGSLDFILNVIGNHRRFKQRKNGSLYFYYMYHPG